MFDIDKEVEKAIRSVIKHGGSWHSGKRHVISNAVNPDLTVVSYFDDGKRMNGTNVNPHDNEVFGYDKISSNFWFSNCGWYTRTTKNLINSCFRALDLPYQTFVSKDRFCIRNTETMVERVIGDGIISKAELLKTGTDTWKKHV